MTTRDYVKVLIMGKHEYGTVSLLVNCGDGNLLGEKIENISTMCCVIYTIHCVINVLFSFLLVYIACYLLINLAIYLKVKSRFSEILS